MIVNKIGMGETGLFSPLFLDFLNQKDSLQRFYSLFPAIENFKIQIDAKSNQFSQENRNVLVSALVNQYADVELNDAITNNIELLKSPKTFTVTTGHQLNIFTGPLYFIYKIVTVINACKELKKEYPEYEFVPVYWMASEDHDFEEISYFNLFGNKYSWETDQKGAVGRFDPSSLKELLDSMPGENEIYRKAYLEHKSLAGAVRYYVSKLFGDEGLIAIDGDDKSLKEEFRSVIKDELVNQTSSGLVEKDSQALVELGYKPQVASRDINLFYLDDNLRERIVKEGKEFKVLNTDLTFPEKEMLGMVHNDPERFSPNVILRPLFQEMVLPNLAYVGGPAEVVYWLQLKSEFDYYQVPFPILLPRNFVLFVDHVYSRKYEKAGLQVEDLFKSVNELIESYVKESSTNDLELNSEKESIGQMFAGIKEKAAKIDTTLERLVGAESTRALKSIEKIENKILKAEKRHHDDHIRQIEEVKEGLFPGGGPQERTLNYLNFQMEDDAFVSKIKEALSPFDLRYHVIFDGNE